MKKIFTTVSALLCLWVPAQVNLFYNGNFEPTVMRGEKTAAYGWAAVDDKRMYRNWGAKPNQTKKEYISGYECFKLDFFKGGMTIEFLEKGPPEYYSFRQGFYLYNLSGRMPDLAAPGYRISGEYKLNKGSLLILNSKRFLPTGNWCKIDLTVKETQYNKRRTSRLFYVIQQPGMKLSLRNFTLEAVYPPSEKKFIRLPDGGRLESLTIPPNASFELRYLTELWRSWLWKLTGTLLPVRTGNDGKNSFVFRKGDVPPGGWKIRVDRSGGELRYGNDHTLSPALYEYIRRMGVIIYAADCKKIPPADPDRILPGINKTITPRFYRMRNGFANGAVSWKMAGSTVDWYTWDHPIWDHHMNTLLPVEVYRKNHPEYYMMQEDGSRQKVRNQYIMSPCLSNEQAKNIIARNSADMLRWNKHCDTVEFLLGDRPVFCYCKECRKNNENYSDIMMGMVNRLAKQAGKIRPGFHVHYPGYLKLRKVPQKIRPGENVVINFCLPPYNWPCNVHVACKENRKAINELIAWSKLSGKENVGVSTYTEQRPWHYLKQLELLNQYAKTFHMTYCGEKMIHYIAGRWNLGVSAEEAIREFNDGYFGKGGEYITRIQRLVEDFCEKYVHRPGEVTSAMYSITVMSWVFDRKTILTRSVFDRIYPLFDQAFAAVGKDRTLRTRLLLEKFKYLRMDLAKYRYTDCGNDDETKAFSSRLQDFIRLCKELNSLKLPYPERRIKTTIMYNMPVRRYLQMTAGLNLPSTRQDWTREPALKEFLKNPDKHLILKPQKIPGGILFMPGLMRGGNGPDYYSYKCPRKLCKTLCRPSSGNGNLSINLKLARKPASPLLLMVEGLDDDKPGTSSMEIRVNGKTIFSGANTFAENNWTTMTFTLPAEYLHSGDNLISIHNTVHDRKEKSGNDQEDIYAGQGSVQNYQWGWICISRIHVLDMASSLQDFLSAGKSPWKKITWRNKPEGVVEIKKSLIHLKSKGALFTGIYFFTPQKENRIALKAGETIRCTLEGSGTVSFGFWGYNAQGKYIAKAQKRGLLKSKTRTRKSFNVTIPSDMKLASIVPFITGTKSGGEVYNIFYEVLR